MTNKKITGLTLTGMLFSLQLLAQAPKNWHLLDPRADGYKGISLQQADSFIAAHHRTKHPVVIAIIDSGLDTTHTAFRGVLWTNKKEIAGNGFDDDGNGYEDDVHGWNFLGGKDGKNVGKDSDEQSRIYFAYKERFASDTLNLSDEDRRLFDLWKKAALTRSQQGVDPKYLAHLREVYGNTWKADSLLKVKTGKESFTGKEVSLLSFSDRETDSARKLISGLMERNRQIDNKVSDFLQGFHGFVQSQEQKFENEQAVPPAFRQTITKDDELDINDRNYGNTDLFATDPFHGTHVVGIIHAIVPDAKLMILRAVPDGDEHDKDIALAIRYAVDHGAKVINMSFGKAYSPGKKMVDEAVRYAQKKGVLLVHAAGNSNMNIDTAWNFPNPVSLKGKRADNWITVGASADGKTGPIKAGFSNYGQQEVDVFAPGLGIWSTIPRNDQYGMASGTSMASPVVAGMAGYLLQYYPRLKPRKLKRILEQSAVNEATLSGFSRNAAVVNLYEAIRLATGK